MAAEKEKAVISCLCATSCLAEFVFLLFQAKLENMSTVNNKLSTQLEQQRLTCADYKRQIEKQNLLTKDLKEKIDKLREELTQSIQNRYVVFLIGK